MSRIKSITLLLFTILGVQLFANQFSVKGYGSSEGLTDGYIYAIDQDDAGFMWFGTSNGLFRFDGYQFQLYNESNGLSSKFVKTIFASPEGKLYAGHDDGTISIVEHGKVTTLKNDKSENQINGLMEYEGRLFALSSNQGIFKYTSDSVSWIATELKDKLCYEWARQGSNIYVATSEGLFVVDLSDASYATTLYSEEFDYVNVSSIIEDASKDFLWAVTDDFGLIKLNPKEKSFEPIKGLPPYQVKKLIQSDTSQFWIATKLSGVKRVRIGSEGRIDQVLDHDLKQYESFRNFITVFQDRENTIWAGSFGAGAFQFIENEFVSYSLTSFIDSSEISTACMVNDSIYFFGTPNGILWARYHAYNGTFRYGRLKSSNSMDVSCMDLVDDQIWVGTSDSGLFRLDLRSLKISPVVLQGIPGDAAIRHISHSSNGAVRVSIVNFGIYEIRTDRRVEIYSSSTGFIHNEVYYSHEDSDGVLWLGTHMTGLARKHPDSTDFEYLNRENLLPATDINFVAEGENNSIWVGTDGEGIFSYSNGNFVQLTTREGLLSNFVNSILVQNDMIWVGHPNGISQIRRSDLIVENLFLSENYFGKRELISNGLIADSKGNILILQKGLDFSLYLIDKQRKIADHLKPEVTAISIFGKQDLDLNYDLGRTKSVNLLHDQNEIKFDFRVLTFVLQDKIEYFYRLKPYETEWKSTSSDLSATYTNLDPGNYNFEVRIGNDSESKFSASSLVGISIAKPYWEEWWFYIAQLLFYALLFLIAYRLNLGLKFKNLSLFMTFVVIFILFEFAMVTIEPYIDRLELGAPSFKVLINLFFALLFFPIERLIKLFFKRKASTAKS